MKKILCFLLLLLCTVSLFAEVKLIFTVNPFIYANNIPDAPFGYNDEKSIYEWDRINTDTFNNLNNDWWMRSQDYWALAYSKPSFFDFGFEASTKNFNLVMRLDIMQDILANLEEPSSLKTNIPFVGALLDLTLPRVAFMDFTSNDKSFYISAGRRLIKWGPGSYDIQIDASQPYLDNIWASFTTDANKTGKWKFNYNYVLVSPKFWLDYADNVYLPSPENTSEKVFLGHKFNFYTDSVRLSFGELANVYDKTPSFFDLSPLVIWHDGNQDENVNVTLYASAEGKVGPVRMFGTFNMDDFELPHETHSNKPPAMGFSAGVEYHVFDGNPITSEKFKKEDYILEEATLKKDHGLNIGFEWYFVSPMMFNRNVKDTLNGKFTVPFQFVSLTGDGYTFDRDAFFLGFKYGPNSRLFKLYAEYKDKPFEANFIAELLTRGEYSIESFYGNRDKLDEMGVIEMMKIAGKPTTVLILQSDFAYYIQDSLKLLTGIQFQQDFTHKKSAYAFSLGFSCNPFNTDWKNLFK